MGSEEEQGDQQVSRDTAIGVSLYVRGAPQPSAGAEQRTDRWYLYIFLAWAGPPNSLPPNQTLAAPTKACRTWTGQPESKRETATSGASGKALTGSALPSVPAGVPETAAA